MTVKPLEKDKKFMLLALGIGRRGLGQTWPNPSVGCVIVNDGHLVGHGYTGVSGRPHAESTALSIAGNAARGATAYVTLEPCSHWGQTPPCAELLIDAGIGRVVIAARDVDARVNGQGAARLTAAGIAVQTGLLEAEATADLAGYFYRFSRKRPWITLKIASTLDGKIATHEGESQWITGPASRRWVHIMRGTHDAILTGIGTVLADDPELTCRIDGFRKTDEIRIVIDSRLRIPLNGKLVSSARTKPVWVFAIKGNAAVSDLRNLGVRVFEVAEDGNGVDLREVMRILAENGLTRVLVEGGGRIASSVIREGFVDQVAWFHSSAIMGEGGWSSVHDMGVEKLAAMPVFGEPRVTRIGLDTLTEYKRALICSPG